MFSSLNVYLKNSCIDFSVLELITMCHFSIVYRNTITSFLVLSIKICTYFYKTLKQANNFRLNVKFTKSKLSLLFWNSFLSIYQIHILFFFKQIIRIFSKNYFLWEHKLMKGRRQLQKNWICFSEKYDNTHFMIYFTCVQMFARRF